MANVLGGKRTENKEFTRRACEMTQDLRVLTVTSCEGFFYRESHRREITERACQRRVGC